MKTNEEYSHYIASLAQKAILYEVSTTPKPGLVDRNDPGAHNDMDFFTFISSSSSLYKGLYECTLSGILFEEDNLTNLLDIIRPVGIECEKTMFNATNGVNTHKGIIFSLGILCASVGSLYKKFGDIFFSCETVCERVIEITKDLTINDFKNLSNKINLTHGEILYKDFGLKGIRGEVESGFQTVLLNGIPLIRNWSLNQQYEKNDLFLEILLNLMAYSQDTNVLSRSGIDGLNYVKRVSKEFLESGGIKQVHGYDQLIAMNDNFIKKNISPGGSADLLAVTIFLSLIEGIPL